MRKQRRGRCCRLAILALLMGACAAPAAPPVREAPAATPPASAARGAPVAPAVVPTSPPPPARLAQVEPGMVVGLIPVRAGAERGLFAEEGIELEFTSVPRGDTRTAALASGGAQIMLGSTEDVVRAAEQDLNLPIVAALLNGVTYNVVGQPRFHALADLRGETIGLVDLTSGSSVILFEMMRANGLELNRDYQALVVGGASERATALRAGAVSATTLPVPDSVRMFDEGYNNLGDAIDYVKEFQNSPMAVRADWAAQNRPLLVRYLRAYLRTLEWVYTQKDEFVPIAAALLGFEPRYANIGWETYAGRSIWPRDGHPTLPGMAKVISILAEQGTFGSNPPPPPSKFLDLSYLEEAQRSLGR
jgi:ABC-type nitrate/sulfonate/bicarbonate transport system substrate-binding protein